MQLFDKAGYNVLKTHYNEGTDMWMRNKSGEIFDIYYVVEILGGAYQRAFSTANIVTDFKLTGIYLYNSHVFHQDKFLMLICH